MNRTGPLITSIIVCLANSIITYFDQNNDRAQWSQSNQPGLAETSEPDGAPILDPH